MSASETTRLHFKLSHFPNPLASPLFASNNNNNNRSSLSNLYQLQPGTLNGKCFSSQHQNSRSSPCATPPGTSRNKFLTHAPPPPQNMHTSLSQMRGGCTSSTSSHPYLKKGDLKPRKPRRLSSNVSLLSSPVSSQSSPISYFSNLSQSSLESPFAAPRRRPAFFLEEERPELTIADRKRLLMETSPHFFRSLTPNEPIAKSGSMELKTEIDKGYESSPAYELRLATTDTEYFATPAHPRTTIFRTGISPIQSTPVTEHRTISEFEDSREEVTNEQPATQSAKPNTYPPSAPVRSKLSLSRRCSEATLPLTFSSKKFSKTIKLARKPRSSTSNNTLETSKKVAFDTSLETLPNDSQVKVLSPTREIFLRSNKACKPRHSMYFTHFSHDLNSPISSNGVSKYSGISKVIRESESEFQPPLNSPDNPIFGRLGDGGDAPSSLSDSDTTEDSFFGEETRLHKSRNSEYASSPNKDSNIDSERYSLNNALDSREFADVSSSVEDIICVGGDLSDSGCHTDQVATKFIPSQSVNKVRLDLNQVKYVGLSLVGGADSPFGNLPVLVKEVMHDGAGERCGISRGDEIIGINNVSLEDKPLQFAVERLRQCSSRDQEIILWVIPQSDTC